MPMIRPRLPFIRSCIVFALSFCHARAEARSASYHRMSRASTSLPSIQDVDGRDKPGHDGEWSSVYEKSGIQPLEHQRGVGAAKTEGIRQHGAELGVVDALANDRHVGEDRIELGDMRAFAD